MLKKLFLLALSSISLAAPVCAGAGSGVDVVKPLSIADPDNIFDELGLSLNYVPASGGDRDSNTVSIAYVLKKMSKRSHLGMNFYVFDYSFASSGSDYDSREIALNLYYSRSIWRTPKEDSWRPHKASLNYYASVGFARNEVDGSVITVGTADPRFTGITAASPQSTNNSFPLEVGLVGTWSPSLRNGFEAFINIDQHFSVGDTTFDDNYKPTITFGADYIFRLNPKSFFPAELIFGFLLVPQANDAETEDSLGFHFGFRKRY